MRFVALLLAFMIAACASSPPPAQKAAETPARFVEIERMAADGLPDQRLTIWLPPGYDGSDRRYPVLYMHDGHNLFDPAESNFDKIWAADKAMLEVMATGTVEPHIIVGIWAPGQDRYRQYLPAFAPDAAEGELAETIGGLAGGPVVSQAYLDWIAGDLKPLVDARYRTRPGPDDTAIAGSSMGGINSCWAIMERPDIFGRAACVSSHWPLVMPSEADEYRDEAIGIWQSYIAANLGAPAGRRIWMDHGTATLDAFYPPYQAAMDAAFRNAGWVEGRDFRSKQYDGAEHEENAWAARLPEVFGWLLAKE